MRNTPNSSGMAKPAGATSQLVPAMSSPLQDAAAATEEGVCISGVACKYPGIPHASSLWQTYRVPVAATEALFTGSLEGVVQGCDEGFYGMTRQQAAPMSPALVGVGKELNACLSVLPVLLGMFPRPALPGPP